MIIGVLIVTRKKIQELKASKVQLRTAHPKSWPLSLKWQSLKFLHLHLQLHFPSWTDFDFLFFFLHIFFYYFNLKLHLIMHHLFIYMFRGGGGEILNRKNLYHIKESWPAWYDDKSKRCCWLKARTFFVYSGIATLQNRSHSEPWELLRQCNA